MNGSFFVNHVQAFANEFKAWRDFQRGFIGPVHIYPIHFVRAVFQFSPLIPDARVADGASAVVVDLGLAHEKLSRRGCSPLQEQVMGFKAMLKRQGGSSPKMDETPQASNEAALDAASGTPAVPQGVAASSWMPPSATRRASSTTAPFPSVTSAPCSSPPAKMAPLFRTGWRYRRCQRGNRGRGAQSPGRARRSQALSEAPPPRLVSRERHSVVSDDAMV